MSKSTAESKKHYLILTKAGEVIKRFELTNDRVLIGRSNENHIIVNDRAVSRLHCFLIKEGNKYVIKDANSKNGIFVNGVKVSEKKLENEDQIKIGNVLFIYKFEREKQFETRKKKYKRKTVIFANFILAFISITIISLIIGIFMPKPPSKFPIYELPYRFETGSIPKTENKYGCVGFYFYSTIGENILQFKAWDIDEDGEVVIYCNNKKIHKIKSTGNNLWSNVREVYLPPESIYIDRKNLLLFVNKKDEEGHENWGISDIKLKSIEKYHCNKNYALTLFNLGKKLYSNKEEKERNLFDSMHNFSMALKFLKSCKNEDKLKEQIENYYKKVKKELETKYIAMYLRYNNLIKTGEYDQAESIIRELLRMFPDKEHPYYVKTRKDFSRLYNLKMKNKK